MKKEVVLATVAGSLLLAATMLPAAAGDVAAPASSMSVADTWWVFHGEVEAGGRFFLNNPQKDGIKSQGGQALGKYYEYSDIKPGPFGQAWLNGQTKDGLYNFNLWGDNVGYNDQRYEADVSKAGEHYFDVIWDQTPHVYSTNAQTLYSGIGGPALVLPPGLSNTMFDHAGCIRVANQPPTGCTSANLTGGNATAVKSDITNNLYTTDLGIRRDTAAVGYRWTPTDAWDINVDYMNMHRWGSQVDGVVFSPGTSGVTAQVPKPVNDTTQNFGINGEYKGTSPWGQNFTFKLGYAGSVYQDAMSSYTVANPFCDTLSGPGECARGGTNLPAPATNASPSSPLALMGLWPDNQAHGFSSTLGADLPLKSRYMGTLSYTMMRQNDAFLPFTNAALVYNGPIANPYSSQTAFGPLPAPSLNGAINTFLSNNVVTTQITPELKSKLVYRYYDFANHTPELFFPNWVVTDVKLADSTTGSYAPVRSLSVSYTKQNAGGQLVWSPNRQWNLGVDYGYEQYKWTRESVDQTHENGGKAFVDYKPWSWLLARASWSVSDRHYDNYSYRGFANIQWSDPACITPGSCNVQYNTAFRQFYLDNRQRQIGKFQVAIDVLRGLTVTPTFGYQDDNYSISATEVGLSRLQAIKSGVEVAYAIGPGTNILFAYMNEYNRQNLKFTTANATAPLTAATTWHSDVRDNVNTIMAAANWAAIPEKLDLRVAYTIAISNTDQPLYADNGTQPSSATGGQFPNISGQWSRLEAQAKYTFDKSSVRMFGINGEAFAKLRYVWERNSVNNVDQDIMQPYMNGLINNTGFMTWMAFDNPNYNAHLIGASLGVKW